MRCVCVPAVDDEAAGVADADDAEDDAVVSSAVDGCDVAAAEAVDASLDVSAVGVEGAADDGVDASVAAADGASDGAAVDDDDDDDDFDSAAAADATAVRAALFAGVTGVSVISIGCWLRIEFQSSFFAGALATASEANGSVFGVEPADDDDDALLPASAYDGGGTAGIAGIDEDELADGAGGGTTGSSVTFPPAAPEATAPPLALAGFADDALADDEPGCPVFAGVAEEEETFFGWLDPPGTTST
jgi:hypothetical protein